MTDELDERLRAALHAGAIQPSTVGVLDRVESKRERRRRARHTRAALAAVVVAIAVGGGVLVAVRDRGPTAHVSTANRPRVVEHPTPALDAGRPLVPEPLVVTPDEGFVRGPVLPAGDTIAVAAYDRTDTGFTFPPSRIVRVAVPSGHVRDRVDLEGEILALSNGEGARWALTRDKVVNGPLDPRFRVKRIASDGQVVSNPVPPAEEPTGAIVAGGGGVWVPVRDGVLRFDLTSGAFVTKVPLSSADPHAIAFAGKGTYVSDGASVLRLDPTTDGALADGGLVAPTTVVGLASSPAAGLVELLGPGVGTGGAVAVPFSGRTVPLPANVDAHGLHEANGVVWVDATIDGAVVAIVLDESVRAVERVVRLPDTDDATITFVSRDRALVIAGGQMWLAALGQPG
jgi:hypothetical protein